MKDEKLYGIHPVLEVLHQKRRRVSRIMLSHQKQSVELQRIRLLAEQQGIPISHVEPRELHRLLGHGVHQGVLAFVTPHSYQAWDEVIATLRVRTGLQTVIALDGVTDVGNFSALIRAGVAFGGNTIIVPKHASVGLTPTVAKHSAGALEKVAVVQVTNLVRALEDLKQEGFWAYGADMRASSTVAQMVWPERLVLVLGAEGKGMRRLVKECCDALIRIPMHAGTDSLNVAVAGAIMLAYRWDHCEAASTLLPRRL
ncbi:MAG: 23S rRNA (guanosine(2251)-2'-O)-methyltransferase RlmB [Candidatus Tectimicrobiota bacterium]